MMALLFAALLENPPTHRWSSLSLALDDAVQHNGRTQDPRGTSRRLVENAELHVPAKSRTTTTSKTSEQIRPRPIPSSRR
jgi:hypothetical protein